ncbi:MAG: DUF3392 family protein [Thiomicrospira sp.]|jgi:hypothetical protein|nr:DUF3392 family protein [Thiomicrospira sp.]
MEGTFLNEVVAFFDGVLITLSTWLRPYLSQIGLAMASTLLVIYGNDIIEMLKAQIGSLALPLRITLFIVFCAFGFSFIMAFLTPLSVDLMAKINDTWLGVVVVGGFYGIGLLALRKKML